MKFNPEKILTDIEAEHGVRILYACESGSRAWGFPSPDSDWDLRLIYTRDLSDYLALRQPRDTITLGYPAQNADVHGWDIRKALMLFAKSNPNLLEWLHSTIRYVNRGNLRDHLLQLEEHYIRPKGVAWHYLSLARNTWKTHLAPEREHVNRKRYFYCLRPVLCVEWMREGRGCPPPVSFGELLTVAPEEILSDVEALLEAKRVTNELDHCDRLPFLDGWLTGRMEVLETYCNATEAKSRSDLSELDALFLCCARQMEEWK